jgi:alkaline phosphatase
MSIGHQHTSMPYTETTVEDLVEPLAGMQITSGGVYAKLGGDTSAPTVISTVSTWWGLDITADDVAEIDAWLAAGETKYWNDALSHVISKNYTVFGWTTHGHTGEDVPVWSYYDGQAAAVGLFDNTDMAKMAAETLSVKLKKSKTWKVYPASVLNWDDPENPVAEIGNKQYPVGKDIMIKRGEEVNLMGITVYNPSSDYVYIPKK